MAPHEEILINASKEFSKSENKGNTSVDYFCINFTLSTLKLKIDLFTGRTFKKNDESEFNYMRLVREDFQKSKAYSEVGINDYLLASLIESSSGNLEFFK